MWLYMVQAPNLQPVWEDRKRKSTEGRDRNVNTEVSEQPGVDIELKNQEVGEALPIA